jgi:hypothetical protein
MISPMPMFLIRLPALTEPYRASGIDDRTDLTLLKMGAREFAVVPVNVSRLEPSRIDAIEDWPWLDQEVLHTSRSHQVCMTCHFFRHHPGPDSIPLLTCHLHQGLIAHGEHLTRRCSGWMENLRRQWDWEPEVA